MKRKWLRDTDHMQMEREEMELRNGRIYTHQAVERFSKGGKGFV